MSLKIELENLAELRPYIVPDCEDQGICVNIDATIDRANILIVKIDDFYNDLNLDLTPPSIDCLIIQKCAVSYKVFLVELKNVKQPSNIDNVNLIHKFRTTLFDFMSDRFSIVFNKFDFHPQLFLCAGSVESDVIRAFSLDFLLGLPLIKFRGKICGVNGFPPHPTILPC